MIRTAYTVGENAFKLINKILKNANREKTAIDTASYLVDEIKGGELRILGNGNIMRLLKSYIIEPTIIVSNELKNEDITEDVIALNIELFTAVYTQAFNILINIHGLDAKYAIELLETRSEDNVGFNSAEIEDIRSLVSLEDDTDILPISNESVDAIMKVYETTKRASNKTKRVIKATGRKIKDVFTRKENDVIDENETVTETDMDDVIYTKDITIKKVDNKDIHNIISKEIVLTIKTNKLVIEVPIHIRSHIIYTNINNILNMIDTNGDSKRFWARWDDYRSGAITLRDMIFAGDLIKEYKRNKLKDEDDLVRLMQGRTKSDNLKLRDRYYGQNYSMLLLTEKDTTKVEYILGGKLSKHRIKEKLLSQIHTLSLSVVDRDWERVVIYTQELKGNTDISFRKLSKKKTTDNSTELLKSIFANKQPVF